MSAEFAARLRIVRTVPEAVLWAEALPPTTTLGQAWELCPRGDWLLWCASACGVAPKRIALSGVRCAATVVKANMQQPTWQERILSIAEAATAGQATMGTIESAVADVRAHGEADAVGYAMLSAYFATLAATRVAYVVHTTEAAVVALRIAASLEPGAAGGLDGQLEHERMQAALRGHERQVRIVREVIPYSLVAAALGIGVRQVDAAS